jgi:tetratricopeptide (TPR) repeat protein
MPYHLGVNPRAIVALVLAGGVAVAVVIAVPVILLRGGLPALPFLSSATNLPHAPAAPVLGAAPAPTDPRRREARALYAAGNLDAAAAIYEALLAAAPGDKEIARELAYVLAGQAGRLVEIRALDSAAPLAERAARLAPDDAEITGFLAEVALRRADEYRAAGRNDVALEILRAAADVAPNDAQIHALLGRAYYEAENLALARLHLRRSVEIDPKSPLAAGAQALLDRTAHEAGASADFQSADLGRYAIRFEGRAAPEIGARIRQVIPGVEARVRDRIGFGPTPPLVILGYGDDRFHTAWGVPEWTGGFFDGKIRIPISVAAEGGALLDRVLLHEVAHAAIHSAAPGRHVPVWLHEGAAQWAEHGGLAPGAFGLARDALRDGSWAPIGRLDGSFMGLGAEAAAVAYAEAAVAVAWLMQTHGRGVFEAVIREIGAGADADAAFRRHLNMGLDDIDAAVRRWLAGA